MKAIGYKFTKINKRINVIGSQHNVRRTLIQYVSDFTEKYWLTYMKLLTCVFATIVVFSFTYNELLPFVGISV